MKTAEVETLQVCCRNSGEMTTSLMNTLLTVLICSYTIFKHKLEADFVAEGDDVYIAFNGAKSRYKRFIDVYNDLGFSATIESLGTLEVEGATFCKIKFTQIDGKLIGYRELGSTLLKLGWDDKPISKRVARNKLNSICGGLLFAYASWGKMIDFCKAIHPAFIVAERSINREYGLGFVRTNATHSFFDFKYGADLEKMTKDIKSGRTALFCSDYPSIFPDGFKASKKPAQLFKDQNLSRAMDYILTGCPRKINKNNNGKHSKIENDSGCDSGHKLGRSSSINALLPQSVLMHSCIRSKSVIGFDEDASICATSICCDCSIECAQCGLQLCHTSPEGNCGSLDVRHLQRASPIEQVLSQGGDSCCHSTQREARSELGCSESNIL